METLGRKGILSIGAVVCIVVLIAGWFLLVAPVKSDISKTKAATAAQTSTNSSLTLTLATMRSIAKQLPQEKAELAALSERVPSQLQVPALLRSIQSAATDTGVTLLNLTPSQPTPLVGAAGISTVGIALTVTGGYAETEQFDNALESLKRTFLVSAFTMAGGAGSAGASASSDDAEISTNLTGQVLVHTATATSGP
jgi:type IV pilus assembly protein PilO